jgi:TnpA family transposase
VLEELLGNATDLPLFEHKTDAHGVTLINFALFDLVGKLLSPRIRDLGKITLVRDDTPAETARRYSRQNTLAAALKRGDAEENGSSTRASRCTRCAATCTTPSREPSSIRP